MGFISSFGVSQYFRDIMLPSLIDYDENVSSHVYEVDRKWRNLSKNHRECIFLENNTGRCKIYKDRPLKCRQEFSIDDPSKCASDVVKHKLIPSMVATYSIDSHASNIFGTVYLSKAIFNELKKNNYNFLNEK